jgi:hypothetical protein
VHRPESRRPIRYGSPPFTFSLGRRDDPSFGTGLLERLARFGKLDLFEAIRGKDSDLLAL